MIKDKDLAFKVEKDEKKKKKKNKEEVNLEDIQKGTVLVKGRKECDCMATTHKLINNCLTCGRIVCEQEGEGACFFCGNMVYTKNNPLAKENFIAINDAVTLDANKEKALAHKEKLLAYDKNQKYGSNIIDDQTDWYEISDNVWLSSNQRDFAIDKIREEVDKAAEDEKKVNITFDAKQMKFVENKSLDYDVKKGIEEAKEFLQEVTKQNQKNFSAQKNILTEDQEKVHKEIIEQMSSKYKEQAKKQDNTIIQDSNKVSQPKSKRVQHDDLFEEFTKLLENQARSEIEGDGTGFDQEIFPLDSENGSCLSMHQPWASLVVYGFKRFEGRMWTSRYRGPLWIQAGMKVPTKEEIQAVEEQYKNLYKNVKDLPPLPERYPTGCLIGIIDLEDIIRVEDYFKYIPEHLREETGCKYLFVCRNPRRLLYPIRLPGERQIFNIDDKNLLESAKKNLLRVKTNWWPYYANELRGKERIHDEDLELEQMRLESQADDLGLLISGFFKDKLGYNIAKALFQTIKDQNKYVGRNYMKNIQIGDNDKDLLHIRKYLSLYGEKKTPSSRSWYESRMNNLDYFVASEKEKDYKIEDRYSMIIVFGRGLRLEYEFYSKNKPVMIKNGMVILRSEKKISPWIANFEKLEKQDEETKEVCKMLENNTLLLMFY